VPVAARAGDQQSATFAQGAHAPGDGKLTLGTSAMLDLNTGDSPQSPPPGSYPVPLWKLGRQPCCYGLEGMVVTAGATVDWLVELGLLESPEQLDRVADSVTDTAGVRFLPALLGLGTPFMDDTSRGFIGGVTRGSSAAHLVRAALEGLAQRGADLVAALGPRSPLRVDGGLARSDRLLQQLADLAGIELLRAAETETTALGAAFLAGLATGVFAEPAQVRGCLAPPERFAPQRDAAWRERERAAWGRFLERARAH
jgi:glycerol kinase